MAQRTMAPPAPSQICVRAPPRSPKRSHPPRCPAAGNRMFRWLPRAVRPFAGPLRPGTSIVRSTCALSLRPAKFQAEGHRRLASWLHDDVARR